MATHKDLVLQLNEIEQKCDAQFRVVFDANLGTHEDTARVEETQARVSGEERAARYGRG